MANAVGSPFTNTSVFSPKLMHSMSTDSSVLRYIAMNRKTSTSNIIVMMTKTNYHDVLADGSLGCWKRLEQELHKHQRLLQEQEVLFQKMGLHDREKN